MLIYMKPYDDNLLNIFHRWMHIVKTNTIVCGHPNDTL